MSWFQLDPQSLAGRVRAAGGEAHLPTLGESVRRGTVGFTVLSVAGFVPWAVFGRALHQLVGEVGMYCVCAAVFIGLSGPLLHRLILGPGSLARFYRLFAITFTANSVLWIGGWMALRGHAGSVAGLLAGTAAMGWLLTLAFDAPRARGRVIAALFGLNTLGYFIGGVVEGAVAGMQPFSLAGTEVDRRTQVMGAKLLWGVFYGLGFGAGLGLAFHECQRAARELLAPRAGSAA